MDCYPENSQVCLEVEVLDASGKPYEEPCVLIYKILDAEGSELFSGSLEDIEKTATLIVEAQYNACPQGKVKDLRRIDLKFQKPDDNSIISGRTLYYTIRSEQPLTVGENSFVTYDQCLLLASTIPHLDQLANSTEDQLVVALLEAHDRLMRLRYRLPITTRMENVGYVSEVAWRPRAITDDDPFGWACYRFTLDEVTPEEFKNLPEKFRNALAKAQVMEANSVLEPTDSIEERRRKGVILETINEVKMMFSSTTPVSSKLTRNAMSVLAPYLDTTVRLRRV